MPRDVPLARRRIARAAAPKYGSLRVDHTVLMRSAGFIDVEELDRTPEYAETLRSWYDRYEEHAAEVIALISRETFEERQRDRLAAIAAVEAGYQRRVLVLGVNPGRPKENSRPSRIGNRSRRPSEGNANSPGNMQWQTIAEAKDKWERGQHPSKKPKRA